MECAIVGFTERFQVLVGVVLEFPPHGRRLVDDEIHEGRGPRVRRARVVPGGETQRRGRQRGGRDRRPPERKRGVVVDGLVVGLEAGRGGEAEEEGRVVEGQRGGGLENGEHRPDGQEKLEEQESEDHGGVDFLTVAEDSTTPNRLVAHDHDAHVVDEREEGRDFESEYETPQVAFLGSFEDLRRRDRVDLDGDEVAREGEELDDEEVAG